MRKWLWAILFSFLSAAHATEPANLGFVHPFYVGGVGGWGSTTWQGLVPKANKQNAAISISTPVAVQEGGRVWGLSIGYELMPTFALEANYMMFPNAQITFDEYSLYAFDENTLYLNTKTQTASLSAKVMFLIPTATSIRVFSSAGIAGVFRQDFMNNCYRISPTFAFGINKLLNERILLEIGTNYTAGYGESEINPVLDFVPFLYSGYGKIALRFG